MPESITQRINASGLGAMSKLELLALFQQLRKDLDAIAAKLDADAGVTDTNYAATIQTKE